MRPWNDCGRLTKVVSMVWADWVHPAREQSEFEDAKEAVLSCCGIDRQCTDHVYKMLYLQTQGITTRSLGSCKIVSSLTDAHATTEQDQAEIMKMDCIRFTRSL